MMLIFKEKLKVSVSNIKSALVYIDEKYKHDPVDYLESTPVIQWAQSMDKVFIEIKLSHRHDSPGCLEFFNERIGFTAVTLLFHVECPISDHPMKFRLHLPLFGTIVENESSYSKSSVSRIVVTLKKKTNQVFWKTLSREGEKDPPYTKTWFEMAEKYEDDIYFLKEKEEEKKEEEEMKELERQREERRKARRKAKENPEKKVDTSTDSSSEHAQESNTQSINLDQNNGNN